jgi:hypothetical protein
MYAGVNNTELCPTRFFTGEPIYRRARRPTNAEIAAARRHLLAALPRRAGRRTGRCGRARPCGAVRRPQHQERTALAVRRHAADLNLGTAGGTSCAPACGRAGRRCWRRRPLHAGGRRPLQGRPHHAPLRPPERRRARGAARDVLALPTWTKRRPGAGTRRAPPRSRRCCSALVQTMRDWRPHA